MKEFAYHSPTTLEAATHLLADYGGDARVLAGGTDLLVRMKRKQWTPRAVVNLKHIPGLADITLDGELHVGPLVTLNALIRSPLVREHFPVLADAASQMAGVQVRNLATIGGNVCNASPAADMAPPLMALHARAVIAGTNGDRIVSFDDFFVGVGKSILAPDEILREIVIPRPDPALRASFVKLEHRAAMDISIASVAVSAKIPLEAAGLAVPNSQSQNPTCEDVRIVLGAVAPTPIRAQRAEEILRGSELTVGCIEQAARVAASEASPIDDVRGSAWYRREMVEVLTRRQLLKMKEKSGE